MRAKLKKKLDDLNFYLGMTRHRKSAMNPGPGIEEEELKLQRQIKKVERELSSYEFDSSTYVKIPALTKEKKR